MPSGFFQVKVGVGTPSATHFKVIFCPSQDWDVNGAMFVMVAASVDYNAQNIINYRLSLWLTSLLVITLSKNSRYSSLSNGW